LITGASPAMKPPRNPGRRKSSETTVSWIIPPETRQRCVVTNDTCFSRRIVLRHPRRPVPPRPNARSDVTRVGRPLIHIEAILHTIGLLWCVIRNL
jgi:hypothetical protein